MPRGCWDIWGVGSRGQAAKLRQLRSGKDFSLWFCVTLRGPYCHHDSQKWLCGVQKPKGSIFAPSIVTYEPPIERKQLARSHSCVR